MNSIYVNRTLRFLFVVGTVMISLIGIFYLSKILYPFLIGLIIAFLINPLVTFFQKKARIPRTIAVIVTFIIIFALFAGILTLLVAEIVSGADYLAKVVPSHLDTLIRYIEYFLATKSYPFIIN